MVGSALALSLFASLQLSFSPEMAPSPKWSAEQVIQIQLEALQRNPTLGKNRGIDMTFRFASPENREQTGPLERFSQMVRSQAYRGMLGHRQAELGPSQRKEERYEQVVLIEDAQGQRTGYLWVLSKQRSGAYKGCWMTDAVLVLEVEEPQKKITI